MKKQNLLKLAFTMLAMVIMTGAMAQTNTGQWADPGNDELGDYVQSEANDKVTVGKSMPFWVWPSAAYNPDFDPSGIGASYSTVAEITANVISSFAWDVDGGTSANETANYVEISWATTGPKAVEVTETPVAGACAATPVTFNLEVIAEPSATIAGAASEFNLTNVLSSSCWADADDHLVSIDVTLPNGDEEYPYHFNVTYNVYNVDGLDGTGNLNPADFDLLADDGKIVGVGGGVPAIDNPIVLAGGTELVAEQDFEVKNNKITVYEIVYNNVNAKISRKSDYLAARLGGWAAADYGSFSYYPAVAANESYYIISLPTPVTGPIYHISNDFAY